MNKSSKEMTVSRDKVGPGRQDTAKTRTLRFWRKFDQDRKGAQRAVNTLPQQEQPQKQAETY